EVTPAPQEEMAPSTSTVAKTTKTDDAKVPEPGFFDGTRDKFDDWWRSIVFYLKYHKIQEADRKIITIISRLRGGMAGAFAQTWADKLESDDDDQDWEEFRKLFKRTFSDEGRKTNAEHQIEEFKQGKRATADFLIEFEVLKTRAETDNAHAIFLLKKHTRPD